MEISTKATQPRIAKFEFVSDEQFFADVNKAADAGEMLSVYAEFNNGWEQAYIMGHKRAEIIANAVRKLPVRATKGSAGYDFFSPYSFYLRPGKSITIPTGIRCAMDPNWVLTIGPKSGLGTRCRVMMRNTLAWIDSDYYTSSNEGHILLKIINDNYDGVELSIKAGQPIMQGVFLPYGITLDDNADGIRDGGFGSTLR